MTKVLFGYSGDLRTVASVYWQDGDTDKHRVLKTDGTIVDREFHEPTLAAVKNRYGRSMHPLHAAEVDDLRSAFKYLGKASDLIELLPEVDLEDAEQPDKESA